MKVSEAACHTKLTISEEQFIQEHFFSHLLVGSMNVYDGHKDYKIKAGDFCIAKRNYLAKYMKQPDNGQFKTITIFFTQEFLKLFSEEFRFSSTQQKSNDAIIKLNKSVLLENFVSSLPSYFNESGIIEEPFFSLKRKELLLILLKENPELANVFFDFGVPGKINLEAFMNRNFRFNVSLPRFAYLTGRSLTSFKRDFEKIFSDTPSHWLIQKRLKEAHFLITSKHKTSSEIYIEVGFEDLSHFSFAFKKLYGLSPNRLIQRQKTSS